MYLQQRIMQRLSQVKKGKGDLFVVYCYGCKLMFVIFFHAASGELFSWGLNGPSGRLGLGHDEHAFVPQQVPLDKPVADVALGTHHAISLCIDE